MVLRSTAEFPLDDSFFDCPELDEILRNGEDLLHQPLCVPDDPLSSIDILAEHDFQLMSMYPNLFSQPTIKNENTGQENSECASKEMSEKDTDPTETAKSISQEDTDGAAKEKRETSNEPTSTTKATILGHGKSTTSRGRPRKSSGFVDSPSCSDLCKTEAIKKRDTPSSDEKAVEATGSSQMLKKTGRKCRQTQSQSVKLAVSALEGRDASEPLETKRTCSSCGVDDTPRWRPDPDGRGTLCNACGLRCKNTVSALEGRDASEPLETKRTCSSCGVDDTPRWRQGPDGRGTLCNACGLKCKKRQV